MITDRIGLHSVLLTLLIAWGSLDFLDDRRGISDNLEPKRRITNFTCPSSADLSLQVILNSLQHGTKTNLVPRAFSLAGKSPGNEVVPIRLKEMPDYLYNTIIITNKTILSYASKNNTNTTIKYNYL